MNMSINAMGLKFKMRPLDMHAEVSLGGLEVQHMQYQSKSLNPLQISTIYRRFFLL